MKSTIEWQKTLLVRRTNFAEFLSQDIPNPLVVSTHKHRQLTYQLDLSLKKTRQFAIFKKAQARKKYYTNPKR